MPFLTREQIISTKSTRKFRDMEVPAWGGVQRVWELTARLRDDFEAATIIRKGNDVEVNFRNMRAELLVRSLGDEQGNRIFTDADIAFLSDQPVSLVQVLFDVALELSSITKSDITELTSHLKKDPPDSLPTG